MPKQNIIGNTCLYVFLGHSFQILLLYYDYNLQKKKRGEGKKEGRQEIRKERRQT